MSLKLGELVAYLRIDGRQLKQGLDEGERDVRRSGRQMERDTTATGRAMATALAAGGGAGGEGFTRDATGRLRDGHGRFVAVGAQLGDAVADGFSRDANGRMRDARGRFVSETALVGKAAEGALSAAFKLLGSVFAELAGGSLATARTGMNNFQTAATNLSTNVANLIPLLASIGPTIGAVGVAAALAIPTLALLGGALGSLPALTFGLGAGVGALGIGFMGLSDAFKETSGSGGAVVDKAWQIAQAERQVRDANREVLASQEALTRSREDAAEKIDDLGRSLAGAHLDEEEAVLAVADAERRLAEVQDKANKGGNVDDVVKADLALRRSKQTLDDVRDRVGDLGKEHGRAKTAGVEGSDEVRAALDRQRKALEGVEDAQHALREAQKPAPGGGGAAAEMMRLAPAAQHVVNVIKSLKPAFEGLRLDVQQKLFAGVGGEIQSLAKAWLPQLHRSLGGMASTFNGIFKEFAKTAKKPEFIANMGAGIESVRGMLDRIGKSVAGPLLDAFGRLSKAAAPFITALGDEIGGLVDDFSRWIGAADKSGALDSFFERASGFLHDVFDIGRDVGSIIGSIFSVLFQSPKTVTESPWEGFKMGMDELAKWFKDPENQKMMVEWFQKVEDFVVWLFTEGIPTVKGWIDKVDSWVTKAEEWGDKIVAFKNDIVGAWNATIGFFSGLPKRISKATSGMWDGLKSSFRNAVNWIIGRWNNLSLTIGGGSIMGAPIPSVTLHTPDIPYLANGGNITRAGTAIVGERGPELVHLGRGATVEPLSGRGSAPAQETRHRVTLEYPDGRKLADLIIDAASLRGTSPGKFLGIVDYSGNVR